MRITSKSFLKYFSLIFSILIILLFFASWYVFKSQFNLFLTEKSAIEKTNLIQYKNTILDEFNEINTDIKILSQAECLVNYIKFPSEPELDRLNKMFLLFSHETQKYDQIRYIDSTGMEISRVNNKNSQVMIVPQENLQNKKHRYYFKDVYNDTSGHVYFSQFDLNIENNIIEQPIKPMIRFGLHIHKTPEEKSGVIILNYLGNRLLKKLDLLKTESTSEIILLNKDSYWLKSNDTSKTWGFMYENKTDLCFKNEYPEFWNNMIQTDIGQIYKNGQLITFERINFNHENNYTKLQFNNITQIPDNFWVIAAISSKEDLNAVKTRILKQKILIFIITSIIIFIVSFIIANAQYVRFVYRNNLIKEKENAIQASMTKDRFLSIIAHDLKNPFSSVLGFSKLLNENYEDLPDENRKSYSKYINDSAQKIFKLFEDLLIWGQSQTGKIQVNPKKIKLKELFDESFSLLHFEALNKGIKLENNVPHEKHVFADMSMIYTVFRNLISNAIKFSYTGGSINCSLIESKQVYTLAIKDQGVGIPPEIKEKLFKIDKTVQSSGTNNESGTGLGLIICKEFTEQNRGKIWVESQAGKGSTFFVSLSKYTENE